MARTKKPAKKKRAPSRKRAGLGVAATIRSATANIHKELAPEVLDTLAVAYITGATDVWPQVEACVMKHFPNAGPITAPKGKYSDRVWKDKANYIARCVKGLPGYERVTQKELAVLAVSKYESSLNDLIWFLYRKRAAT